MSTKKISMLGWVFSTFLLSSLAITASAENTRNTCTAPTDDELIELAIDGTVGPQPGSVSIPQERGPTIGLLLAPFPTREAYIAANPDCCLIVTEQTLTEGILPEDIRRLNYSGSVRIQTTFQVMEVTNPNLYPSSTYTSVRVIDFDKCGKAITLD